MVIDRICNTPAAMVASYTKLGENVADVSLRSASNNGMILVNGVDTDNGPTE